MPVTVQLKGLEGFRLSSTESVEEGPFSAIVQEKWVSDDGKHPIYVAVKTAPARRQLSKEPHDIIKELRILSRLSHINVIYIIGQRYTNTNPRSLSFWMPYIHYSLSNLLSSPSFSPRSPTDLNSPAKEAQFSLLAKSIMFQVIAALRYLHSTCIAHRDIKPGNILLTKEGCVKIIDFGISWEDSQIDNPEKRNDLWPEYPQKMYFEVSTGPYRAPELLFGPETYDAFATDLWSLGATFAEFFTSIRLSRPDDHHDYGKHVASDSDDVSNVIRAPFVVPKTYSIDYRSQWSRDPLFNGGRGEIGLAWSIFQTRGTPTAETWPTFKDLPHASRLVTFNEVPPAHLPLLLPNLPREATDSQRGEEVNTGAEAAETHSHFPAPTVTPSPLDLLHRLLVYPPPQRLKAADALRHPWFNAEPSVLLPVGYPTESDCFEASLLDHPSLQAWQNKTLGEWLVVAFDTSIFYFKSLSG